MASTSFETMRCVLALLCVSSDCRVDAVLLTLPCFAPVRVGRSTVLRVPALRARNTLPSSRSSEEETRLSLLLERAIRKADAIDRESLCIVAGEKVLFMSSFGLASYMAPTIPSRAMH